MAITTTYESSKGRGKRITRVNVDITVTSATSLAATSIGNFYGRLVGIYSDPVAGAGATMDSTADVLLTDALTGAALISDLSFGTAEYKRPTANIVGVDGAAISAAATAVDVNRDIYVAGGINLALANVSSAAAPGVTGRICFVFEEV